MLNDYYQNIGFKEFISRYGIINAIRRGLFMATPFHYIKNYEIKKVLWQEKASGKIEKYLKYENVIPNGIKYSDVLEDDVIWIYWNTGMENAPTIVKKCYESICKYGNRQVIVLTEKNMSDYIRLPDYIECKMKKGLIPMAGYADLLRFALLEHYGGTWIDSTVLLTKQLPQQILECDFFVLRNSLGLIDNPVLYPAWLISTKKKNSTIIKVRNVAFAYWTKENHVIEYLLPNLIITQIIKGKSAEKQIPYMTTDYSEHLIRVLGDTYTKEKLDWIKSLTGIHKLSYKLDEAINRPESMYRWIIENEI